MPSRIRWLVAFLAVSLIATITVAAAVYPRYMPTYLDALGWGLVGSSLFLLATIITGLAVAANREAPLPIALVALLVLLLAAGAVWAWVWTVAVGL